MQSIAHSAVQAVGSVSSATVRWSLLCSYCKGEPIDPQHPESSRLVYFAGCSQEKSAMRVAKISLGEETVLRYSWDRSEHAHTQTPNHLEG